MVVDTGYYDALQVTPLASELDIKKAYRKLAVKLHPDKNPGDEEANKRFQEIGEAYQVLSDPQLRAAYDKYGKDKAIPDSGFDDPSEFFGMVFGGDAFAEWIGEISLMKDLTQTMEISMREEQEEEIRMAQSERERLAGKSGGTAATKSSVGAGIESQTNTATTAGTATPRSTTANSGYAVPIEKEFRNAKAPSVSDITDTTTTASTAENPYTQERPRGLPTRLALTERSEEDAAMNTAGVTEAEKELRAKEKKKGLTKEQREELRAYELERQRIRDERVATLAKKLLDRLSVWTETDKGSDVTAAFREKTRMEVENLTMESFGLEILHSIGTVYVSKATAVLKSHRSPFGIGGMWARLKDKGAIAKDTWGTISTAIDAQMSMEAMAKAEQEGGEGWTDEMKAEHEKRVTGKILAAAWRGSKMEIQSVLREVCDTVLGDRKVSTSKRVERAQGLLLMGECFCAAKRDSEEEGDYMVFEQLMAESMAKKERKDDKKKKDQTRAEAKTKSTKAGTGDAKLSSDSASRAVPEKQSTKSTSASDADAAAKEDGAKRRNHFSWSKGGS